MMDSKPDARTLSYINLYAVLGTLENLCELDEGARALLTNKNYCIKVKDENFSFVDSKKKTH